MNWLISWLAGRWLPIAVTLVCAGLLWAGYTWAYGRGEAAVEARWEAERAAIADAAARADATARERERRQREDYAAAERRLSDAQARNDDLARLNADAVRRLRERAASGGGAVCEAAGDTGEPAGTAGAGVDAGRASVALAEFAQRWAAIRDAEAARLRELQGVVQMP